MQTDVGVSLILNEIVVSPPTCVSVSPTVNISYGSLGISAMEQLCARLFLMGLWSSRALSPKTDFGKRLSPGL